jgi:diamine N-acetyltransferase
MSLKMDIIKAKKKDIPGIVFLNSFVQKIHAEKHSDLFKPVVNNDDLYNFFDSVLSKKTNLILIAYMEGMAVGYLWAAFDCKPDNPLTYERRQVYIHHIGVHEQFRRKHVGKSLFDELKRIARNEGFAHFAVDAWFFNKNAQKFFKSLGFDTYNIKMWQTDERAGRCRP